MKKLPVEIIYINAGCELNTVLAMLDYSTVTHGGHNSCILTATINVHSTSPNEIDINTHNIMGASIVISEIDIVATGNLEAIIQWFSNTEIWLTDIHISVFDL